MLTFVESTAHTPISPARSPLRSYLDDLPRGALAALARDLEIERVYLSQLLSGYREASPKLCAAIERATGGKVTCEALRPDIVWHRVTDPGWPHHPDGRPVVEVVTPDAPAPDSEPGALDVAKAAGPGALAEARG